MPSTIILTLSLSVIILIYDTSASTCPSMCSCIWRNGKQTALCEKQGLISIPSGISSSTQVLNLNKNNFQILPARVFQERGLINLQKVHLAECKLGVIADDAFTQLTNLIELDLNGNLLTNVPTQSLKDCVNLRRLQLNANPIQVLRSDAFAQLHHLKSLDVSGSQIDMIEPGAFRGLEKLEFLKLDANRLTSLPASVVADLPPLYSFDLHRNPWNCDCDLRAAREWMLRNNVPQSVPPTCQSPQRVSGLMWNSLDIDDFACAPDILTTSTEMTRHVGGNATLSCLVKGLPEPKVNWYVDNGFYRNLSSQLVRGEKFFLTEERAEGMVTSQLTIAGLEESDTQSFICSAENRAGISTKNFTVSVLPLPFGIVSGWSKVEMAGAIVGLLLALVLFFVILSIILIRTRRGAPPSSGKSPSTISVFKHLAPGVKTDHPVKSHVTVIGKDGHERKENGNASSGYGSGGLTPDLTKQVHLEMNGYSTKMGSNHNESIGQISSGNINMNYQYGYNNYQDVYDADGYGIGLPPSVAAQFHQMPPRYSPQHNQVIDDQQLAADYDTSYNHQESYQNHLPQNYHLYNHHQESTSSQPSPSNCSSSQQWKRAPMVGGVLTAPTVVRYSPDEGYAEETAPYGHLEGTEV